MRGRTIPSRVLFTAPSIVTEEDPSGGGALRVRSADPLGDYPVSVLHSLRAWAAAGPDHPLVAERNPEGGWRRCSYGAAAAAAEAIGQALLDRGLGPDRPLLVLSGNSVNHLLVTLGAMTAGGPVAPVSVAYSLQSRDHARIRAITELIQPGAVFAEEADRFAAALDTAKPVAAAFAALTPDTVAKLLFTSGSTGMPKGVLNTHRMLSANQQMMRQAWPFLAAERPVIVDWLPWSHTFGGNHNMNMVLTSGGTLYVDAGRPAPSLFAQTIMNLSCWPRRWRPTTTMPGRPCASSGCWSWPSPPTWMPARSPTRATSTSAECWPAGLSWPRCCTPIQPRPAWSSRERPRVNPAAAAGGR